MKHYKQFRMVCEGIEAVCCIVGVALLAWFIYQVIPFFPIVD